MKRLLISLLGMMGGAPVLASAPPTLPTPIFETRVDPDAWLTERVAEDRRLGVWPQALPRIQRTVDG